MLTPRHRGLPCSFAKSRLEHREGYGAFFPKQYILLDGSDWPPQDVSLVVCSPFSNSTVIALSLTATVNLIKGQKTAIANARTYPCPFRYACTISTVSSWETATATSLSGLGALVSVKVDLELWQRARCVFYPRRRQVWRRFDLNDSNNVPIL